MKRTKLFLIFDESVRPGSLGADDVVNQLEEYTSRFYTRRDAERFLAEGHAYDSPEDGQVIGFEIKVITNHRKGKLKHDESERKVPARAGRGGGAVRLHRGRRKR